MEKRLTRDVKNKKIAGVCAGIANYYNIDPTLIRVLWIVSVVFAGGGVLAYLLCWFLIPEDTSSTDDVISEQ